MFLRLLPRALMTFNARRERARRSGIGTLNSPERYLPVQDFGASIRSSTWPSATISPPWMPAPGPISSTWSALRMASSSCSTTITVLPRSRSRVSVSSSRWLSRWCRPIDGSSRMYITPTSPEPVRDLVHEPLRDLAAPARDVQLAEDSARLGDRQGCQRRQVVPADEHVARGEVEPAAVTIDARTRA